MAGNLAVIKEEDFKCIICNAAFTTAELLAEHNYQHLADISARRCNDEVVKLEAEEQEGNDDLKYKCSHCDLSYRSQDYLNDHYATVHKELVKHSCNVCGKSCSSLSKLKAHELKHSDVRQHKCDKCERNFKHAQNLRMHKKNVHEKHTVDLQICKHCDQCFKSQRFFKEHMLKVHGETVKFDFICTVCSVKFDHAFQLKRHMLKHDRNSNSPDLDSQSQKRPQKTGSSSSPENDLQQSNELKHTDLKKQQNDQCNKELKYLQSLQMHSSSISPAHDETAEFSCEECGKLFATQSKLKAHKLKHSNLRQHACNQCDKMFKHAQNLRMHKKNVHEEHTPDLQKCERCDRCFKSRRFFKEHMLKVHNETVKNDIICTECGAEFGYVFQLRRHMLKHDKKPSKSEVKCHTLKPDMKPKYADTDRSPKPQSVSLAKNCLNKIGKSSLCRVNNLHKDTFLQKKSCTFCGRAFLCRTKLSVHLAAHNMDLDKKEYNCHFCAKSFKYPGSLRIHIQCHRTKSSYKCSVCAHGFNHQSALTKHMKTKHGSQGSYTCMLCGTGFTIHQDLTSHIARKHSGWKMQECKVCSVTFRSKFILDIHSKKHKKPHACDICGKSFGFNLLLMRHKLLHLSKKQIVEIVGRKKYVYCRGKHLCDICGIYVRSKKDLKDHIAVVHWKLKEIKCVKCNKTFEMESALKRHEQHVHLKKTVKCRLCGQVVKESCYKSHILYVHNDRRAHKCDQCDKAFKMHSMLKRHMIQVHSHLRPFTCADCGKSFALKERLNNHMKCHKGVNALMCQHCGLRYANKRNLTYHLIKAHGEPSPYVCNVCGEVYGAQFLLRQHMTQFHSEKGHIEITNIQTTENSFRTFVCNQCGAMVSSKEKLKEHINDTHGGKSVYICCVCKDQFGSRKDYRTHMQQHASKLYTCDLCNKTFTMANTLKRHIRVAHTVEPKPFQCPHCDKCYRQRAELNVHVKDHESGPQICDICFKTYKNISTVRKHKQIAH